MDYLREFYNNALVALQTTESYVALIGLGIAFLFGWWTGWLTWGRMASRRKKAIRKLESELNTVQTEFQVLADKYKQKENDFNELSGEFASASTQLKSSENELQQMHTQLLALKDENINLQTDIDTYLKKIDTLDNQIISLQARNTQLNDEIEESADSVNDLVAIQSSYNATRERLSAVENKIAELVGENKVLKASLNTIQTNTDHVPSTAVPLVDTTTTQDLPEEQEVIENEQEEEVSAAAARVIIQNAIGTTIPKASEDEKDDLTKIDGIGSFIEQKLHDLGIYTYGQIAQWDDSMIEAITTAIEFFPGRIHRDNWVGQAWNMIGSEALKLNGAVKTKDTTTSSKSKKKILSEPTNLKIIEGIGPKIEQLLKSGGIKSWADLAGSNTEHLQRILKEAGGHYRLADPSTWVAQARLADSGDWNKLEEYQDSLKGGREIRD